MFFPFSLLSNLNDCRVTVNINLAASHLRAIAIVYCCAASCECVPSEIKTVLHRLNEMEDKGITTKVTRKMQLFGWDFRVKIRRHKLSCTTVSCVVIASCELHALCCVCPFYIVRRPIDPASKCKSRQQDTQVNSDYRCNAQPKRVQRCPVVHRQQNNSNKTISGKFDSAYCCDDDHGVFSLADSRIKHSTVAFKWNKNSTMSMRRRWLAAVMYSI